MRIFTEVLIGRGVLIKREGMYMPAVKLPGLRTEWQSLVQHARLAKETAATHLSLSDLYVIRQLPDEYRACGFVTIDIETRLERCRFVSS